MVNHPLVATGTAGDGIDPRAGEAMGGKFGERCRENAAAGAVWVTRDGGWLLPFLRMIAHK